MQYLSVYLHHLQIFFINVYSFHSTGIAIPKLNLFLSTLSFWCNYKGVCFLSSSFWEFVISVQFSSVTQSCMTLFNPKDCSMPGFPVHHQLLELSQWVHSLHQVVKVLEFQLQHQSFQWIFRTYFLEDWLVWSLCTPRDSQESSPTPQFKSINS